MSTEELITAENCNDYCIEMQKYVSKETSYGQAAAWTTVFNFCIQNGMPKTKAIVSGIERVISFIGTLVDNQK